MISCRGQPKEAMIKYSWTNMNNIDDRLIEGKKRFQQYCTICHLYSIQGDAHFKNKNYWQNIYEQDLSITLLNLKNGYKGKSGIMPSKGGCYQCDDEELINALVYMFNKVGVLKK